MDNTNTKEGRRKRLLELIQKETGGNKTLFAKSLGFNNASAINHILKGRNDISNKLALKICAKYLCSYEWLMIGIDYYTLNVSPKKTKIEDIGNNVTESTSLTEEEAERTIHNLVVHEEELEKYVLFRTWKERIQMTAKNEALLDYLNSRT